MNKVILFGKVLLFSLVSVIADLLIHLKPRVLHTQMIPYDARVFIDEVMGNAMVPWQALVFGILFGMMTLIVLPGKNTLQDLFAFALIIPLVWLILVVLMGFLGGVLGVMHLRADLCTIMLFALFVALITRAGLHIDIGPVGLVAVTLGSGAVMWAATAGLIPAVIYELRFCLVGTLVALFGLLAEE